MYYYYYYCCCFEQVDPAVGDKGQATTAGRVLKSVTSFCVIIILMVYTGQTAAALTAVTLDIQINSLEDLVCDICDICDI